MCLDSVLYTGAGAGWFDADAPLQYPCDISGCTASFATLAEFDAHYNRWELFGFCVVCCALCVAWLCLRRRPCWVAVVVFLCRACICVALCTPPPLADTHSRHVCSVSRAVPTRLCAKRVDTSCLPPACWTCTLGTGGQVRRCGSCPLLSRVLSHGARPASSTMSILSSSHKSKTWCGTRMPDERVWADCNLTPPRPVQYECLVDGCLLRFRTTGQRKQHLVAVGRRWVVWVGALGRHWPFVCTRPAFLTGPQVPGVVSLSSATEVGAPLVSPRPPLRLPLTCRRVVATPQKKRPRKTARHPPH